MLTDNIFLPFGGICMCYYVGWKWKPDILLEEIRQDGVQFKLAKAWLFLIRFITPVMVAVVTLTGFFGVYQTIIK